MNTCRHLLNSLTTQSTRPSAAETVFLISARSSPWPTAPAQRALMKAWGMSDYKENHKNNSELPWCRISDVYLLAESRSSWSTNGQCCQEQTATSWKFSPQYSRIQHIPSAHCVPANSAGTRISEKALGQRQATLLPRLPRRCMSCVMWANQVSSLPTNIFIQKSRIIDLFHRVTVGVKWGNP